LLSRSLFTWRRAVADVYGSARAAGSPEEAHALWVAGRDTLFREHPDSPLAEGDPMRDLGIPVAAYDPDWRAVCAIEPAAPQEFSYDTGTDGRVGFERLGILRTPWGDLDAWWLRGYGGGLFLPVKDASAGSGTYGGGRYLLDTAKGADLGGDAGGLVVDLNFAYHPSCRYDPAWVCPLAPAGNVLAVDVPVGERLAHAVAEFAFPGELRDRLVAAILAGDKTTTAGLLAGYEIDGETRPRPGQRQVVIDSAGTPVAMIETDECRVVRVADVPECVAELGDPGFTVTDDTLAVLERFHLVRRL
jgi:hypothetical protein